MRVTNLRMSPSGIFRLGALVLLLVVCSGEAEAIVGMPATPVSYAGVARRTTRRAVAVTSPYAGADMPWVTVASAALAITDGVAFAVLPADVPGMTWAQYLTKQIDMEEMNG